MFTNPRIEVSATQNVVRVQTDPVEAGGEPLDELVELHEENVGELREALQRHGHALGRIVELRSPEDDALRRMVGNLVGVAQFSREARRLYSGR